MGDFNLHSPICGPFRAFSYNDLRPSAPLVDQASQNGFSLVSPVGTHTFLPNNLSHRPSVLDLAFASSPHLLLVSDACILDSAGSDHHPVLLRIAYPKTPRARPTPNWKRFDIEKTLTQLQALPIGPSPINPEERVSKPLVALGPPQIFMLVQAMVVRRPRHSARRLPYCSPSPPIQPSRTKPHLPRSRHRSKGAYFHAIKSAKSAHWRNFLETASADELWAAKCFRDPPSPASLLNIPNATIPDDLARGLVRSFFPTPPVLSTRVLASYPHPP